MFEILGEFESVLSHDYKAELPMDWGDVLMWGMSLCPQDVFTLFLLYMPQNIYACNIEYWRRNNAFYIFFSVSEGFGFC